MSKGLNYFLIFLFFLLSCQNAFSLCNNCNVILISLDTVGAKHIGLYNSSKKLTPNIDAFGNQSRVYLNAYSSTSWTLPAHSSMLTGHFHWQLGVFSPDDRLPDHVPTLADTLKSAGYDTMAFVGGSMVSKKFNLNKGFDQFEEPLWPAVKKDFSETLIKVETWINTRKNKKPFFLFIHTYDAHEPFTPSEEALGMLANKPTKKTFTVEDEIALLKSTGPKKNVDYIASLYEAGLYDVDKNLGLFFEKLKAKNLLQNTIIVLTSDHGEELGEHDNWGVHGFQLYDEVLKIPLIYYVPNAAVKKMKSPVSLVDIAPTIVSELGLPLKEHYDGSPLPRVDKEELNSRPIFSEVSFDKKEITKGLEGFALAKKNPRIINAGKPSAERSLPFKFPTNRRYAVIQNKNKMIFNKRTGEIENYNLEKDPEEKNPLPFQCSQLECIIQNAFIFKSGALK